MHLLVSCRFVAVLSLIIVMFAGCTTMAYARELPELSAAERRTLGIEANQPVELEKVAEGSIYEPTPDRQAHFNITELHMGSIARGRWLFAVTFAEPYTFDNTSLLLYVDADNDPQTGRPGMGNEVVYGVHNGNPTIGLHVEEERIGDFHMPRVALVDGVVFLSVDMPLNQEEGRSRFRISILSEQSNPHEGRDRLPWNEIDGPGGSDLEPFKTLAEIETTSGFLVTQSMSYLWQMQADERNIILNSYNDCEYEGFTYFHSEYRWPALRRTAA